MDDSTIKLLIGAGAAIAGAIATAIAKHYSTKQRLAELKFQYETKLNDGYLEQARDYTRSVYVPLSIELVKINRAFQTLLSASEAKREQEKQFFLQESKSFLEAVEKLGSEGANAFYTTDLDETLVAFCGFLTSSYDADDTQRRVFVKVGFSSVGLSYEWERDRTVRDRSILKTIPTSVSLSFPFTLSYRITDVVAAPVDSDSFQERFARDVHFLNSLVKEVTLGAKARSGTLT